MFIQSTLRPTKHANFLHSQIFYMVINHRLVNVLLISHLWDMNSRTNRCCCLRLTLTQSLPIILKALTHLRSINGHAY